MELLAGDRLGKYEIVGRLAAGGMAEVYLARSLGHGGFAKPVALKRMLPDLASEPGFREMFMQEASVAARLNHPNIVQIFDFAEERGELYLAMELVHGVTLKQLHAESLARGGKSPELRMSPMLAARICQCVARALAHAWQAPDERGLPSHLIHRDVSPQNILISYEGDVKLADFGIARPAERRTSVGMLKGKLLYMAPEQLQGGALDARTDIFALGIVLYELALSMRKPLFDAGSEDGVKQALQAKLVVPPERMDPDFSKSLSALIMRALDRDPRNRFQSAAELAETLGAIVHEEAKGPLDYEPAAFMRLLYREPPPIGGLRQPPRSQPVGEPGEPTPKKSALELRGDDPLGATIRRDQAEVLRHSQQSPEATRGGRRPRPVALSLRAKLSKYANPRILAFAILPVVLIAGVSIALPAFRASPSIAKEADDQSKSLSDARTSPGAAPDPAVDRTAPSRSQLMGAPVAVLEPGLTATGQPESGTDQSAMSTSRDESVAALATSPGSPEPPASSGARGATSAAKVEGAPPAKRNEKAAVTRRVTEKEARSPQRALVSEAELPETPNEGGVIVIRARPWGFAWVDNEPFTGGKEQEAAPALRRYVSAGKHRLFFQDPVGNRMSMTVVVHPGKETVVEDPFGSR